MTDFWLERINYKLIDLKWDLIFFGTCTLLLLFLIAILLTVIISIISTNK